MQGRGDTELSESLVLDALSTLQSREASMSTEASVEEQGIWRSNPLPSSIDNEEDLAQDQYRLLRRGMQGLSMAPAVYVLAERFVEQREEGSEHGILSVPESLPSLISGDVGLASDMTQSEHGRELLERGSSSDETISTLLQAEEMGDANENNSEEGIPYYGQSSSSAVSAG